MGAANTIRRAGGYEPAGSTLSQARGGASAVEFALVLPLLLSFLCGTFQYGTLMFAYNAMMGVARDATRQMSVGAETESGAAAAARMALPRWVAGDRWAIVTRDVGSTGTNRVQTTISVAAGEVSILNLVPMPSTLSVNVVMQKES